MNVYTFVAIYSFVDRGTNHHCCKLWGMSENLICICVWWARVTIGISKVILCHKYVGVIYVRGVYYNNNNNNSLMGYSVRILYYGSHRWYVCNKIK